MTGDENVTARPAMRGAVGIVIVLVPLVAGIMARSPWVILIFGVLFAFAYIIGRFVVWKPLLRAGLSVRLISMLASTLLVQLVVVAVLYLIGFAFAWLFGDFNGLQPLGAMDVGLAFMLVAANAIAATAGSDSAPTR